LLATNACAAHTTPSTVISLLTTLLATSFFFFFFNDPATTEIYTLSLHDALPISPQQGMTAAPAGQAPLDPSLQHPRCVFQILKRSEEHTSELQSRENLVCRLLLEKKKKKKKNTISQTNSNESNTTLIKAQ